MKSRWKQLMPIEAAEQYVALVSSIPPKRHSSSWRMFKGSREVAKQLEQTDGVVGFSMLARPVKKEYATISLWIDDAALEAFARSAQHARWSEELADEMAPTKFVRWQIQGSDGVPPWSDALGRLSPPTIESPFEAG